ncbi:RIP-like protein [Sergentomyia squamirostris]
MNTVMTSPTQRAVRRSLLTHSPILRDMLREKCRIRMKQARLHTFNRNRNLTENDEALMTSIFRNEISELDRDIEIHETTIRELMNEADQWMLEENEKIDQDMISGYETLEVFCPMCQKNCLQQEGSILTCICGMKFPFESGLERFQEIIQLKIAYHETFCNENLQFITETKPEPGLSSLSGICSKCEYFTMIVV